MRVLAILAAAAALGCAAEARADPLGLWQAPGSALTIRIAPCGAALCGVLVNSNRIKADPNTRDAKNPNAALRSRPLRGVTMLQSFTGGPPKWQGSIYFPADGGTYKASFTLSDADTLSLRGCKGPFCQTQVFKRAR